MKAKKVRNEKAKFTLECNADRSLKRSFKVAKRVTHHDSRTFLNKYANYSAH